MKTNSYVVIGDSVHFVNTRAGIRKAQRELARWDLESARIYVSPNTPAVIRKREDVGSHDSMQEIFAYVKPQFMPSGMTAVYLAEVRATPGLTAHGYLRQVRECQRARNDYAYRSMRTLERNKLVRSEVRGRTTVYYPAE